MIFGHACYSVGLYKQKVQHSFSFSLCLTKTANSQINAIEDHRINFLTNVFILSYVTVFDKISQTSTS